MLTTIRADSAHVRRICSSNVTISRSCLFLLTAPLLVRALPAWSADLGRTIAFNIPAQPLDSALIAFAKQAHVQVVIAPFATQGMSAPAVTGSLSAGAALTELLDASGLRYQEFGDTVTVLSGSSHSATATIRGVGGDEVQPIAPQTSYADASSASAGGATVPSAQTSDRQNKLEEVVVTAQKRTERLQDVPVPVTAIDAQTLVENNQLRLQDYYNTVPGFNVATSSVAGYQLLSIRGITTGVANPTVGITVDDVPFGSSTVQGGNVPPDLDPGDLSRIEVLRGPQGTLYGASSIGGLVKYVTLDPSTAGTTGSLQAGTSSVYNGDQLGYNARGSINLPLSDTLAIRASAFARRDPGYVDNPVLHIDGINRTDADGAHLSALWRPSDVFSLKLSALILEIKAHGAADVDNSSLAAAAGYPLPKLVGLQQDYIPGAGGFSTKIQAYSATARAKLGAFELTSITGYNSDDYKTTQDFSYLYGRLTRFRSSE